MIPAAPLQRCRLLAGPAGARRGTEGPRLDSRDRLRSQKGRKRRAPGLQTAPCPPPRQPRRRRGGQGRRFLVRFRRGGAGARGARPPTSSGAFASACAGLGGRGFTTGRFRCPTRVRGIPRSRSSRGPGPGSVHNRLHWRAAVSMQAPVFDSRGCHCKTRFSTAKLQGRSRTFSWQVVRQHPST